MPRPPTPAHLATAGEAPPLDRSTAWVRVPDGLVSATVLALAWWTVVFHVAQPLDWHRDLAGALWLGGLLAAGGLWVARARTAPPAPHRWRQVVPQPSAAIWVLAAAVIAACAVSATRWSDQRPAWWAFWLVITGASVGAVWLIASAPGASREQPDGPSRTVGAASLALVVAVALAAALGSALTQRPDADDVFLVNRSTYVAEHPGPLPERDTLFSDEVFAVTRPDAVPTSVEPLIGVLAAWSPFSASTVTYLLVGPAVAALGVLALWRMLRTLGAAVPALAVTAAAAFLLLDGASVYSFGSFSFVRSWQGKVIFLLVVVPALWHHALRWARDGSRRDAAMLLAANVAGIGLSTTAVLLGPAVTAVAVVGGCWGSGAWRRLAPGLATATPALIAAAAFTALPRQDPTPVLAWVPPWFTLSGGIEPGRQWHWIYDEGIGLLIPAAAACLAWATVRDRSARLALALAPLLLFGFFYGPGTFDAIAEVSGVRSILWRTGWLLPVPAAVGLVMTAPAALATSPLVRRAGTAALSAGVLLAMALGSTWVLDGSGGTQGVHLDGFQWDVDPTDRAAAQRLIDLSEPGDVVLAPERIGQVIATQTTRVRALNPRGQYLQGRHVVPEFHSEARQRLTRAATTGAEPPEIDALVQGLDDLSVDTACLYPAAASSPTLIDALQRADFALVEQGLGCAFWRR